eukprot:CAMPEP_0119014376 /NCGR_PEP_ID=MMETSP1176-20130426/9617_1 /TAXON_ID=265551 /ORGANISM="Synedropsis recta cf, Strain CCMP1620" /LENGTH=569 /DNA_ID=CAMNT_0006967541 /DNA_START=27 /DNA_END=1736 /DNA_ORIENTATION=-
MMIRLISLLSLLSIESSSAFVTPTVTPRPHSFVLRSEEVATADGVLLNEQDFLQDMEEQMQGVRTLSKQAKGTTGMYLDALSKQAPVAPFEAVPATAAAVTTDMYLEAGNRLARLAEESTAKFNVEPQANEIKQVINKKEVNDHSTAFMLLGVAIAASTVATGSPDMMEQLSTFDMSTFRFDDLPTLSLPTMDAEFMGQLGAQATVLKGSVMEQASHVMDQVSSFGTTFSMPAINVDTPTSDQLAQMSAELMEPLRANMDAMKDSVMEQALQAKDSVTAQLDTMSTVPVQMDTLKSELTSQWSNMQELTSFQISQTKESVTAQVARDLPAFQQAISQTKESVTAHVARDLPAFQQALTTQFDSAATVAKDVQGSVTMQMQDMQDSMPGYADTVKLTISDKTASLQEVATDLQATVATKSIVVQENMVHMVENVQLALVALLIKLQGAVGGAQYTLQTSVENVNDRLPEYVDSMKENLAIQTFGLQNAVKDAQDSASMYVGDLQDQLPGYMSAVKENMAAQTTSLQGTVQDIQSSVGASVGNLQEQIGNVFLLSMEDMPELPDLEAIAYL